MKKAVPAKSPDDYVRALTGWRRALVERLRAAVVARAKLEEVIKWGNVVYLKNGPGGKYEMATLVLHEGDTVSGATVRRLTRAAVTLNTTLGNPTDV